MGNKSFFIFILSSFNKVLYIGITGNLGKRIWEHREAVVSGFTKKYNVKILVYSEEYDNPVTAIKREGIILTDLKDSGPMLKKDFLNTMVLVKIIFIFISKKWNLDTITEKKIYTIY